MRAYVGGIYMSKVKLDGKVEHLIFLWVLLKFIQKFHQKMSKASKEIRNISWLQGFFKFSWKFHQILWFFHQKSIKLLKPSISALSHPFLITKRSIFYHLMFVSQTTAHFHYVSDKVDFHVATFGDQKYIKAKLNSAAATVWRERFDWDQKCISDETSDGMRRKLLNFCDFDHENYETK